MECLIEKCSECGGFCCKVISLDRPMNLPLEVERLTPAKALELNPFLPLGLFLDKESRFFHFYKCIHLKDGLCSIYEYRPEVCKGYPFYDNLEIAHSFIFPVPWCRYREDSLILQGIPYAFCSRTEIDSLICSDPEQYFFVGGLRSGEQYPIEYLPARADFSRVVSDFLEKGSAPLTLDSVPTCLVQRLKDLYRFKFVELYRRTPAKFTESHFRKAVLFCLAFGLNIDRFFDLVCRFSWQKSKDYLVPVNHLNSDSLRVFVMRQISKYGQIQ